MTTAYLIGGYPASGKSTALNEAYRQGLYTVEMGEVVRNGFRNTVAEEENADDDTLGAWATHQRNAFGPGTFAEDALDLISRAELNGKDVAVSGVRCEAEVERFKSHPEIDKVTVIGIRVSKDVRFQRLKERDGIERGYFDSRTERERDWGMEKLLNRHTNIILRNSNCSEERFRTKVRRLLV